MGWHYLHPTPPDRPVTAIENIPVGARINGPEISESISRDIALGLVTCSSIMGQCIREDIAAMFGQFHITTAQLGARLLRMNKEKGWLFHHDQFKLLNWYTPSSSKIGNLNGVNS